MLGLSFWLCLLLNLVVLVFSAENFTRDDFPPPSLFVFGAGTSAFQYEGAESEDGRTPSIWDNYTDPVGNKQGENGKKTCNGYHKYKEDVQLMADTGLEAYRFSISWSRLIPNGRGPVNPKGLVYYNNLINELTSHGIQLHVTLSHSDLPQVLEDEYGGYLSRKIVKDFTKYADVCFREFGDRVLHWTTFNEANIFVIAGYDLGMTPPSHCSPPFGFNCATGNSSTEPYVAAHNIMLAHASAARLYKKKYQDRQHGFIGITIFTFGFFPYTNATEDVIATQRAKDFFIGWFLDPLVFGDYPDIVKKNVGKRLPAFTKFESEQVKNSFDFIGLNHYTTVYIKDNPSSLKRDIRDFNADIAAELMINGDATMPDEYSVLPYGLVEILEYFKQYYGNPPIYIHENGQQTLHSVALNDTSRINFIQGFIGGLLDAVRNGCNARGYFVWSFLDLYELFGGFEFSFGLYYVDLDDKDLKRFPKLSAKWYSSFLKERSMKSDGAIEVEKNMSALSQSHFSQ
ncbi:beta-glucosidase 11-like isoform X1 [Cornus florida]|uniref:beta-glucosidase 11-like isoform X1 n=2 Tax=Cornus florida TaxID=4283 RepID=UPI00289E6B2C|nr:beta-glucosidase 11-like isoform X1 [Cornus florida]